MRAIIIAVGSELLHFSKLDTNSLFIGNKLSQVGIVNDMNIVVGDELEDLCWCIKNCAKRCQLLIITGGLGPTEDDITREAVSRVFKRELIFNEDLVTDIKESFKKRGMKDMPQINARQGFVLEGAKVIKNFLGTAPGQILEIEGCKVVLLPGPPLENRPMFEQIMEEEIRHSSKYYIANSVIKTGGASESQIDEKLSPIYAKYKNPSTTILSSSGLTELRLRARSKVSLEEAVNINKELMDKMIDKLGENYLYSDNIDICQYLVNLLREKDLTVSFAESCTGGLLSSMLTDISGASEVYLGGVNAYSNQLKEKLLGVEPKILESEGAVSAKVALSMAQGVLNLSSSDISVSITGIAGPGGGGKGKPVGLVYFSLVAKDFSHTCYRIFPGDRKSVKLRTANYAFFLLIKFLKDQLPNNGK